MAQAPGAGRRNAAGEWAEGRVPVSGHYVRVCPGDSAAYFLPKKFERNFAAALSASGALLALEEMICAVRCEDTLLGSTLMKMREVLWVDSQRKKPNSPRRCFKKYSMCPSLIFKIPSPMGSGD